MMFKWYFKMVTWRNNLYYLDIFVSSDQNSKVGKLNKFIYDFNQTSNVSDISIFIKILLK